MGVLPEYGDDAADLGLGIVEEWVGVEVHLVVADLADLVETLGEGRGPAASPAPPRAMAVTGSPPLRRRWRAYRRPTTARVAIRWHRAPGSERARGGVRGAAEAAKGPDPMCQKCKSVQVRPAGSWTCRRPAERAARGAVSRWPISLAASVARRLVNGGEHYPCQ